LEFIYSMPGSVAGAVWMNARCYDREILQVLEEIRLLARDGSASTYRPDPDDFGYKKSPFQKSDSIMVGIRFRLQPGDKETLWAQMRAHELDRREKGHFEAPCAGSVFKNNRAFGRPSGAILDSLDMRGRRVGGARVSDLHANIIQNSGGATAEDIRRLSDEMAAAASGEFGYALEREILLVGDWGEEGGTNGE
jgi:UDP-N-acetylmuramate dehydrogenase